MTDIAILLFEGLTALDAVGPYEVLQRIPGAEIRMVGREKGWVRAIPPSLGLSVDHSFDDVPTADILVVPGGFGVDAVLQDAATLEWIRRAHESSRWTTSVCTGSLLLGAAGVLKGLRATTHWRSLDRLEGFGATPTGERVVFQGKVVTAAGVSSGIDMALALAREEAGEDVAKAIQLSIEYDPQPPFDAGSLEKAGERIAEMVRKAGPRIRKRGP
jgi:putative intracellular protease/amidase